jgi:hypothetical protein
MNVNLTKQQPSWGDKEEKIYCYINEKRIKYNDYKIKKRKNNYRINIIKNFAL